jgi:hypothetical protein
MGAMFQMTPGIYEGGLIMIGQSLTSHEEPTCAETFLEDAIEAAKEVFLRWMYQRENR